MVRWLGIFLCIVFIGCATYPEQRAKGKPYPAYASWSHWYFSNIGYKSENSPMFRDLQLSDEQGWWGEEVVLHYEYEPYSDNIDTFEGK